MSGSEGRRGRDTRTVSEHPQNADQRQRSLPNIDTGLWATILLRARGYLRLRPFSLENDQSRTRRAGKPERLQSCFPLTSRGVLPEYASAFPKAIVRTAWEL